jgi:alpha-aminoadipic semialdehyde synthase
MLDAAGARWVSPEELVAVAGADGTFSRNAIYAAVFKEVHMVERRDGGQFELQEFYDRPDLYRSVVPGFLPSLSILVNTIFWAPRYPVYVPNALLKSLAAEGRLRLQVIGDITCDISGSIEATRRATDPGDPCYDYLPEQGIWRDEVGADGVTVMAVDALPCEFPREASVAFSRALRPFLEPLAAANFDTASAEDAGLPKPLERAVIAWRGKLRPEFGHLQRVVDAL